MQHPRQIHRRGDPSVVGQNILAEGRWVLAPHLIKSSGTGGWVPPPTNDDPRPPICRQPVDRRLLL